MKKQLSHPLKMSMWSLQYHTWKGSKTFSKKTILSSTQNLKIKFRWPKIVINISTTLCVLWNNMFNDPEEISKLLKEYICVILKISWKNTFFTIFTPKIRVCTYYTVHLLRNFRYYIRSNRVEDVGITELCFCKTCNCTLLLCLFKTCICS